MTKPRKPRKLSEKQLLIQALLSPSTQRNWPLEMKMLGQILARVSDVKFWFHFGEKHKYATLIHLLSDLTTTNIVTNAFHEYTKKHLSVGKVDAPVKLEQENVGEDIIIQQPRQKTLKDFLTGI
jgi:hypothetical protein